MLQEKIQADVKEALKSGEAFRLSTLRMAQATLHNRALEKRAAEVKAGGVPRDAELTDEETLAVLRSEVKRRRDAAGEYERGGRRELAEKELQEKSILEAYLPAEADEATVANAVAEAIAEAGSDPKQFGRIMGIAMKKLGGSASGERVSRALKEALGG